jgi:hypothetical protein
MGEGEEGEEPVVSGSEGTRTGAASRLGARVGVGSVAERRGARRGKEAAARLGEEEDSPCGWGPRVGERGKGERWARLMGRFRPGLGFLIFFLFFFDFYFLLKSK